MSIKASLAIPLMDMDMRPVGYPRCEVLRDKILRQVLENDATDVVYKVGFSTVLDPSDDKGEARHAIPSINVSWTWGRPQAALEIMLDRLAEQIMDATANFSVAMAIDGEEIMHEWRA